MLAPHVWLIIREALEKVLPEFGKHQRLEAEAAVKRAMNRAKREHVCNWDQEAARRMMPCVEMCPGCRTFRFRPDDPPNR